MILLNVFQMIPQPYLWTKSLLHFLLLAFIAMIHFFHFFYNLNYFAHTTIYHSKIYVWYSNLFSLSLKSSNRNFHFMDPFSKTLAWILLLRLVPVAGHFDGHQHAFSKRSRLSALPPLSLNQPFAVAQPTVWCRAPMRKFFRITGLKKLIIPTVLAPFAALVLAPAQGRRSLGPAC